MMGKSSACWHFCEKIDSVLARCKLCLATVVHDGNTTNLNRHLKEKHRRPYLAYKNSLELRKEKANTLDTPDTSDTTGEGDISDEIDENFEFELEPKQGRSRSFSAKRSSFIRHDVVRFFNFNF